MRSARTLSGRRDVPRLAGPGAGAGRRDGDARRRTARRLESIFLDEGFGTLDPDTLDVVAAAIEELGSSGRMVGVVTHIRELADRMPVRFEVTKAGVARRPSSGST